MSKLTKEAAAKKNPLSKEEAVAYRRAIDQELFKHLVVTKQPEELHYIIPEHTFRLIMEVLDRALKSL